nr:zinc finger, CCHC-type [Tanacetum cinerariifolium]
SHSQKGSKGQNQGKGKFAPKPKISRPPKRENPAKDSICHECGEIGHWKRNCPKDDFTDQRRFHGSRTLWILPLLSTWWALTPLAKRGGHVVAKEVGKGGAEDASDDYADCYCHTCVSVFNPRETGYMFRMFDIFVDLMGRLFVYLNS